MRVASQCLYPWDLLQTLAVTTGYWGSCYISIVQPNKSDHSHLNFIEALDPQHNNFLQHSILAVCEIHFLMTYYILNPSKWPSTRLCCLNAFSGCHMICWLAIKKKKKVYLIKMPLSAYLDTITFLWHVNGHSCCSKYSEKTFKTSECEIPQFCFVLFLYQ